MGIPLYRLPFVIQVVLFTHMDLVDTFIIPTLSKRARNLSKFLFKPSKFYLAISSNSLYTMTLNGQGLRLDLMGFHGRSATRGWKVLREIFVPSNDRLLCSKEAVLRYGSWDWMTLKMHEFLFEVFTNISISIVGTNKIQKAAELLDTIKSCKEKFGNEKATVKFEYYGYLGKNAILPALNCDQVTFIFDMSANQLIQMAMTCKRLLIDPCSSYHFPTADLKEIIDAWMSGSRIEYMELIFNEKVFYKVMEGVSKRKVKFDGKIQSRDWYVIRQAGGKEAVVYHSDSHFLNKKIFLRTDFEEVVKIK